MGIQNFRMSLKNIEHDDLMSFLIDVYNCYIQKQILDIIANCQQNSKPLGYQVFKDVNWKGINQILNAGLYPDLVEDMNYEYCMNYYCKIRRLIEYGTIKTWDALKMYLLHYWGNDEDA